LGGDAGNSENDMRLHEHTTHEVEIDGRIIPKLTANHAGSDAIELVLDGRFSATFPTELAHQAAWMIANALAIGGGYPSMNADTKDRPFAPVGMQMLIPLRPV
jgi:hypothetical protein